MNIGIIGLGDMGRLYAKAFAEAGYKVCGCDLPENRIRLEEELAPYDITVMDSGKDVSRISDLRITVTAQDLPEPVVPSTAKCLPRRSSVLTKAGSDRS